MVENEQEQIDDENNARYSYDIKSTANQGLDLFAAVLIDTSIYIFLVLNQEIQIVFPDS